MVYLFVLIRHIRYKPFCVILVSGKVEVIFPVEGLNCVKSSEDRNRAKCSKVVFRVKVALKELAKLLGLPGL
jgi:hypothetical protein